MVEITGDRIGKPRASTLHGAIQRPQAIAEAGAFCHTSAPTMNLLFHSTL